MNNKNEYEKILKIVDEDSYLRDEDFTDNCAKKFRNVRVLFYIVVFIGSFLVIQDGRIIPTNNLMVSAIAIIMPAVGFFYLKQRNNLHREINRYVFRECYPDRGLSRYLSFVPLMLRGEMIWSITQYNFGCIYYRLGKIGKANALLNLMQESCTTAGNMLLAEHLKQLIALYYKDYDTVITCANESAMLYPKVRRTIWNTKPELFMTT